MFERQEPFALTYKCSQMLSLNLPAFDAKNLHGKKIIFARSNPSSFSSFTPEEWVRQHFVPLAPTGILQALMANGAGTAERYKETL